MLSMTWLMLWNSDSSWSKLHLQHFVYRSKSPFANVEWNMCTISKCGYKHVQHFDSQPQFTLATAPELFSFWGHLHNLFCHSEDSNFAVPDVNPSILGPSPELNFLTQGTSFLHSEDRNLRWLQSYHRAADWISFSNCLNSVTMMVGEPGYWMQYIYLSLTVTCRLEFVTATCAICCVNILIYRVTHKKVHLF